ncbi:hypothetical protein ACR71G_15650 [Xenorhabdus bovienii]|uniref:hypothetical protein n=1 Tax=Xenorhabdus bovienii TaxID=40576 RepID=UPI003DA32C12
MAKGQVLFHGGSIASGLKIGEFIKTDRPFSTSFSPVKALLNALHLGKAYDENQVNLLILRVVNSKTKAFIFNINEIDKGHEKEVLFASNLTLTLRKKTPIAKNYTVYGYEYSGSNCTPKDVPAYLLHIDIS